LRAVLRHTRRPFELILVDNGSTDGTREYLAGIVDAAPVSVTVIPDPTNLGFPAAINQALKAARGEYLVLLNNDSVVTDGWLGPVDRTRKHEVRSPQRGIGGTGGEDP
jgi:glycosyltransferase involved in cell wall biosynthesis